MDFKTISVREQHGFKIVEVLEKRIYLSITEIFKEELIALIEQGNFKIVIDLRRVEVINSAGLGVLILARDVLMKKEGIIKLTNLQQLLSDIFSRMKLDMLFKIYKSNEEAVDEE
jgi:anti-sigma B factor antagonist